MNKIDLFIPYVGNIIHQDIEFYKISQLPIINKVYLLSTDKTGATEGNYNLIYIDSLFSTDTFRKVAEVAEGKYILFGLKTFPINLGSFALQRFFQISLYSGSGICYADYRKEKNGVVSNNPLIDYQKGSLRDNFDFGNLLFIRTEALKNAITQISQNYQYAGLYDLRLKISQAYPIVHINEYLYTVLEDTSSHPHSNQFDYVNPVNRETQKEMEAVCTEHLKSIGAYLPYSPQTINLENEHFEYEASIIIPVRNRVKTIEDAIKSALEQETAFPYNVIVIDNHSTDGTTEIIKRLSQNPKVVHIIPERNDLGIGGCWNLGIFHPECGKFAVQLDSDDLYSSPQTLQKIVDAFYQQKCGMIIGSYRITDFNLTEIPPGIIDHSEWSDENGPNNALRINGLGAPRAFYTPIIRKFKFPDTSYGEDYAVGLRFSREFMVGRIYDVLYNCRRWDDNSDANLCPEKINVHNHYKDKLRTWEIEARIQLNKDKIQRLLSEKTLSENEIIKLTSPNASFQNKAEALLAMQLDRWKLASENYMALNNAKERLIKTAGLNLRLIYNPGRLSSITAQTDKESIAKRKCFLCLENLPSEQKGILFKDRYILLCNPYPVFEKHFTIPDIHHVPQTLNGRISDMLELSQELDNYVIFYNGARCGASAPDHFHFQAVEKTQLPLCKRYASKNLRKLSKTLTEHDTFLSFRYFCNNNKKHLTELISQVIHSLSETDSTLEPMFNILCWRTDPRESEKSWIVAIFPRKCHRPKEYYAKGSEQILISPAALEMSGVFTFPIEEHFRKVKPKDLINIYKQL
ncbi:MAG: DUF4922 domain-containing protein [Bacteroidales bacterium]|nr:DUF4922 domain-containing protein [Bacteroidales bacterium]